MRKLFIILSFLLVLSFTGDVSAQQVGDKMPTLEGYVTMDFDKWRGPSGIKHGHRLWKGKAGGEAEYLVVYIECNGITAKLPFGIS